LIDKKLTARGAELWAAVSSNDQRVYVGLVERKEKETWRGNDH
jgi:hypothetical protein